MSSADTLDLTKAIDDGGFSGFQIRAIALCALIALFDGIDSQSIAIAAPVIAKGLNLSRAALGPVFSAALLGASIGALILGPLGDRYGRKRMLIAAAAMFGLFTILTAYADSFQSLIAIRFLAGLGLGGATPCFVSLACEYAPSRRRAMIASLIWAAFPLGGMLGGFVNAGIIAALGWRAMFLIGGALPLLAAVALAAYLPESARFLLSRGGESRELRRIVGRLVPGAPQNVRIVADEPKMEGAPIRQLFANGLAVDTLLIWLCFVASFSTLGIVVLWTPILLAESGVGASQAALALGFHGLGALIGVAAAGRLVEQFGASATLVPTFLLGAIATGCLGFAAGSLISISATLILIGLLIGVAGSGAIALAAITYPTAARSSGVGWAMGVGRLGQVAAPLLAAALVGLDWKGSQIFVVFGVLVLIGALAALRLGRRDRSPALARA